MGLALRRAETCLNGAVSLARFRPARSVLHLKAGTAFWQQRKNGPQLTMKPLNGMSQNIELLAKEIVNSKHLIAFTGAGISTESGIPDYRSKGGIWDKFRPVYIDEFMSSQESRIKYWQRKTELYSALVNAPPNAAHRGLAELYRLGFLKTVITQNIDGLHQKAGVPDDATIELHGNNLRVRCMSCGSLSSIHEAHERIQSGDLAPECECGGFLKPDTISFGQSLRSDVLAKADEQCRLSSAMLIIGSTLIVHPAAELPSKAKQSGAFIAIINLSDTPCDAMCDLLIREKAGIAMQAIINQVNRMI
jgi:NAD-dependent deacetylase